jgi:hypothetical protein
LTLTIDNDRLLLRKPLEKPGIRAGLGLSAKVTFEIVCSDKENAGVVIPSLAHGSGKPCSYVAKYECGDRRLDVLEYSISR